MNSNSQVTSSRRKGPGTFSHLHEGPPETWRRGHYRQFKTNIQVILCVSINLVIFSNVYREGIKIKSG